MSFAGNVSLVTVTGTYVDFQGNPIAGQVIFYVPMTLRNALADQILVPSSYYVTLDGNGQFSVVLPATDDPDFDDTFTYTVTESFVGGRTYSMTLPEPMLYSEFDDEPYSYYTAFVYSEATGFSADLADLAPIPAITPYVAMANQANYLVLEDRVTAAEATVDTTPPTTGVILTLAYDSLAVGYATYTVLASSGPASYTLLSTSQILATTAGVQALAVSAQASASAAQASQAAAVAAEVRDPHPFVFTGVA